MRYINTRLLLLLLRAKQLLIFSVTVNYLLRRRIYHAFGVVDQSKYESRLSARRRSGNNGGTRVHEWQHVDAALRLPSLSTRLRRPIYSTFTPSLPPPSVPTLRREREGRRGARSRHPSRRRPVHARTRVHSSIDGFCAVVRTMHRPVPKRKLRPSSQPSTATLRRCRRRFPHRRPSDDT